jgi:hypothetical protein
MQTFLKESLEGDTGDRVALEVLCKQGLELCGC